MFVDEYLVDLNATRAYKVAYPSCKKEETINAAASRMLRNVKVREYIDKRMKDRQERTEITQDFVLKELYAIASAKGSDFAKVVQKSYMKPIFDKDGNKIDEEEVFYRDVDLVLTDDLPEDKKKAIAVIKQTKFGIAVESCDKVKALELLGRHLGIFTDKVEYTGSVNVNNPFEGLTKEELLKLASEDDG
ncbi:terminase small subunit [Clostridium sp. OS1-26]|nr:terminase small subunit [Clostridium sp. OS1-26]WML37700.1 terminase small subunit [Clostridium sp. OS1-26]